jgi:hypothetical protein
MDGLDRPQHPLPESTPTARFGAARKRG